MTTQQIDPNKLAVLNMPHNIMIADTVVDVNVSGFTSTITLGYTNPAGAMQPAVTLLMPTNEVHSLANEIIAKLNQNKQSIKDQHHKFSEQL